VSVKLEPTREGCTGKIFGLYYKVNCVRYKKHHEIYLYATEFRIQEGDLILFKEDKPYRAFAKRAWTEIVSASCWDGSEMWEEQDWAEVGK
jgi:hypothetical protein